MSLVHLARKAQTKIHITIFYKAGPLVRGTAFSTYSVEHLLNVAAKNMSAFPEQANHFVEWLSNKSDYSGLTKEEIGKLYVPRNVFGSYLEEIWNHTLSEMAQHVSYSIINSEVSSITSKGGMYELTTREGKSFDADKIIIASGNQLPRAPLHDNHPIINSPLYFPNPWDENCVTGLREHEPVLIIGTGLTMVDVVIGLTENNFNGKIICVSPKGFHILPHRVLEPYPDFLEEIKPPYELGKLFRIFRKHIRLVKASNRSGEIVVDALRSRTQEVWQALSLPDRKKFMTHVRHLWGVARHRLPATVFERIQALIKTGKLEILAGRIISIETGEKMAGISIKNKKNSDINTFTVQRIINCTGPESDPVRFKSKLFSQMLQDGLICCDEMQLGILAKPDGSIIDAGGNNNKDIYVIGSLLRGTLWETTAVPELRVQAEHTAVQILADKISEK